MSGSSLVDVTFVDADTREVFLQLKLPARLLPDSFVAQTTLSLGQDDWWVLEADPPSAAEFVSAGALRLVVRRVESVDPSKILFSLPTVADEIPRLVPRPAGLEDQGLFRLHEDDWLQLELVPSEVAQAAQPDLEGVQVILRDERQGVGFKKLQLRKALREPWRARGLELPALQARFGQPRPIAYFSGADVLEGGFAFRLGSGAVLYGEARDARVLSLGVAPLGPPGSEVRAELSRFAAEHRAVLIDWCAATVLRDLSA